MKGRYSRARGGVLRGRMSACWWLRRRERGRGLAGRRLRAAFLLGGCAMDGRPLCLCEGDGGTGAGRAVLILAHSDKLGSRRASRGSALRVEVGARAVVSRACARLHLSPQSLPPPQPYATLLPPHTDSESDVVLRPFVSPFFSPASSVASNSSAAALLLRPRLHPLPASPPPPPLASC